MICYIFSMDKEFQQNQFGVEDLDEGKKRIVDSESETGASGSELDLETYPLGERMNVIETLWRAFRYSDTLNLGQQSESLASLLALPDRQGRFQDHKEYLEGLLEKINQGRVEQVHPDVLEFIKGLVENPHGKDRKELFYFIIGLLGKTKPKDQKKFLDENGSFLDSDVRSVIIEDLQGYLPIEIALSDLRRHQSYFSLFDYYSRITPEERGVIKKDILKDVSEAGAGNCEDSVFRFYRSLPENEKGNYKESIDKIKDRMISDMEKYGSWVLLEIAGYFSPNERKIYRSQIDHALKLARKLDSVGNKSSGKPDWNLIFEYYSLITPGEREEIKEKIIAHSEGALFDGFIGPQDFYFEIPSEERKNYQMLGMRVGDRLNHAEFKSDKLRLFAKMSEEERRKNQDEIDELLAYAWEKTIHGGFGGFPDYENAMLEYLASMTDEERKEVKVQEIIDRYFQNKVSHYYPNESYYYTLKFLSSLSAEEREKYNGYVRAIFENSKGPNKDAWVGSEELVKSYSLFNPADRKFDSDSVKIARRSVAAVRSEVGDADMRRKYLGFLRDYSESRDLSLVGLNSVFRGKDRTVLSLGFWRQGVDPLILQSWDLKKEHENSLIANLGLIKKDEKNLFRNIRFPFRPRGKGIKAFESEVAGWLKDVAFMASLGQNLEADEVLKTYLYLIEDGQRKSGIYGLTRNIPRSFLRDFVERRKEFDGIIIDNFKKLFGMEGEQITPPEMRSFAERWGNDITAPLILAARFKSGDSGVRKSYRAFEGEDRYGGPLQVLGRAVLAEIKGRFFEERYKSEAGKKQLFPFLAEIPGNKWDEMIDIYHHGAARIFTEGETVVKDRTENFTLEKNFSDRLVQNLLHHDHLEQSFSAGDFSRLDEHQKKRIKRFIIKPLIPAESEDIKHVAEFKRNFNGLIGGDAISAFIALHQFFNELTGKHTAEQLLNILDRTVNRLPDEIKNTGFISQDVGGYLKAEIVSKAVAGGASESRRPSGVLLAHTTDHPKTMMEIGKFPLNSGSCQSYDYETLSLVSSLPGYVLDAHIQAVVVREVEGANTALNDKSTIEEIDEGRRVVKCRVRDELKELRISKPIARKIIMLGNKDEEGILVDTPLYEQPGAIDADAAGKYIGTVIDDFISKLNVPLEKLGRSVRRSGVGERGIMIPGSRNPAGHYNDLLGEAAGDNGKEYEI